MSWEIEAQRAAEKHLQACEDRLELDSDGVDSDEPYPATATFCGCNTCIVREVLHAAWPVMRDAALEGAR